MGAPLFMPVLLILLAFLALVGAAYALHRFAGLPSEVSRKFLHVSGGLLALSCPLWIHDPSSMLLICGAAFLFLLVTFWLRSLPAVHRTARRSVGSVVYPVPVFLCFLAATRYDNSLYYYIPIAFLTLSDTAAEWGGKKWGHLTLSLMGGQKTLAGSFFFACTSFLLVLFIGLASGRDAGAVLLLATATSLTGTLAELVSTRGLDNLTVPLGTLLCLMAL